MTLSSLTLDPNPGGKELLGDAEAEEQLQEGWKGWGWGWAGGRGPIQRHSMSISAKKDFGASIFLTFIAMLFIVLILSGRFCSIHADLFLPP